MFTTAQNDKIQEFKFYMLLGDKNSRKLHITNPYDVLLAVKKAYIDMQPRTIDGLGLSLKSGKQPSKNNAAYWNIVQLKEKNINDLNIYLANQVVTSIKRLNTPSLGQSLFDSEHNGLCQNFIMEFKKRINSINSAITSAISIGVQPNGIPSNYLKYSQIDTSQITYGKAQKIVNMTFKYLSLFDDANQFSNVFQYCHVAIDRYIIEEVNQQCKNFKTPLYAQQKAAPAKAWSNYDYNDYINMLTLMRNIISSPNYAGGKVLFFEEFDWWMKHI